MGSRHRTGRIACFVAQTGSDRSPVPVEFSVCLLRRRPEWRQRLAVRDDYQPLVGGRDSGDAIAMTDEASPEKPAKPVETVRKAECSQCNGPRYCEIRGRYDDRYDDDDSGFWGNTTWYILECRGCEYVFVQTVGINSEDIDQWCEPDGSTGGCPNETLNYWPALSKRRRPEWMSEYGIHADDVDGLDSALRELYGALDNDLSMLAAIGIRTCFDIASELLKIDPALTFAEKLNALVDAKHIRQLDRQRLETAVEVGNATAHRGWKPTTSDLDTMATVLEEFVFDAFVQPHRRKTLDEEAAKVRGTVPPKPIKKKKVVALLTPATPDEVA